MKDTFRLLRESIQTILRNRLFISLILIFAVSRLGRLIFNFLYDHLSYAVYLCLAFFTNISLFAMGIAATIGIIKLVAAVFEGQKPKMSELFQMIRNRFFRLVLFSLFLTLPFLVLVFIYLGISALFNGFPESSATQLFQLPLTLVGVVLFWIGSTFLLVAEVEIVLHDDNYLKAIRKVWKFINHSLTVVLLLNLIAWGVNFGIRYLAQALIENPITKYLAATSSTSIIAGVVLIAWSLLYLQQTDQVQ